MYTWYLVWSAQVSLTHPAGLVLVACFFFLLFFVSQEVLSAIARFVKRTFPNFHKNLFLSHYSSLVHMLHIQMRWRQPKDRCSIQTDSGRIQCVHNICQNYVKTVPYLESSMRLTYEELFYTVVNFIYFG